MRLRARAGRGEREHIGPDRLESEICRLRKEWDSERRLTNKMFELLVAQIKTTPSAARDPEGSEEDTERGRSKNSSDGD